MATSLEDPDARMYSVFVCSQHLDLIFDGIAHAVADEIMRLHDLSRMPLTNFSSSAFHSLPCFSYNFRFRSALYRFIDSYAAN